MTATLRRLLPLAALALASCHGPANRPDSVLILDIDTLRADGLGCYGNPRGTSPELDRLAANGVRFEWAFAQAPNTPPSQASILTGLFPSRHGRMGDADAVRPSVTTLAESFRAAGLETAAFVDGGFLAPGFGLEQGFDLYDDSQGGGLRAIVPKAGRWLRGIADRRFLLFVHTYDVHAPYAPPEPLRERFAALVAPPTPGFAPTSEALEAIRKSRHLGPGIDLPDRDVQYARALYDGEVRYVDDQLAALLAELRSSGLDRRTIVVVISDHGEEFLEHGSVLHEKLYVTVLRVPWILEIPGGPSRVVAEPVQTVDLVPTLHELLDLAPPAALDGRSVVPAIRGLPFRGHAFAETPFLWDQRALVVGPWHFLFRRQLGRGELYRYPDDPSEQRDLASAHSEIVERFRAALEEAERRLVPARNGEASPPAIPNDATLAQLRALGYLP